MTKKALLLTLALYFLAACSSGGSDIHIPGVPIGPNDSYDQYLTDKKVSASVKKPVLTGVKDNNSAYLSTGSLNQTRYFILEGSCDMDQGPLTAVVLIKEPGEAEFKKLMATGGTDVCYDLGNTTPEFGIYAILPRAIYGEVQIKVTQAKSADSDLISDYADSEQFGAVPQSVVHGYTFVDDYTAPGVLTPKMSVNCEEGVFYRLSANTTIPGLQSADIECVGGSIFNLELGQPVPVLGGMPIVYTLAPIDHNGNVLNDFIFTKTLTEVLPAPTVTSSSYASMFGDLDVEAQCLAGEQVEVTLIDETEADEMFIDRSVCPTDGVFSKRFSTLVFRGNTKLSVKHYNASGPNSPRDLSQTITASEMMMTDYFNYTVGSSSYLTGKTNRISGTVITATFGGNTATGIVTAGGNFTIHFDGATTSGWGATQSIDLEAAGSTITPMNVVGTEIQ